MRICIFYNGTDSNFDNDINWNYDETNRFRAGEIISRLSHIVDFNKSQVLQVNGVGTSNESTLGLGKVNLGTLVGSGIEENVQIGKRFWETRMRQSLPGTKNELIICGWSRRGITAMCLARAVCDYLDQTPQSNSWKIKIMVFDPVAGIGTNYEGKRKWYELGSYVTEYVGFYAREEISPGFATTIPSRKSNKTKMTLIDVAGFHSSLVGSMTETTLNKSVDIRAAKIYRKVKNRALQTLCDNWQVPLIKDLLNKWNIQIDKLARPNSNNSFNLSDDQSNLFRKSCAVHKITTRVTTNSNVRGVYVGNNNNQRQWILTKNLYEFLMSKNETTYFDSSKQVTQTVTQNVAYWTPQKVKSLANYFPDVSSYVPDVASYLPKSAFITNDLIISKVIPNGGVNENFICEMIDGVKDGSIILSQKKLM